MSMKTEQLEFSYQQEKILKGLNIEIAKEKITTIIGANGCGKSTLLKLLSRTTKPTQGNIFLYDKDIFHYKDFSQHVAIVHQNNVAPEDVTVEKMVAYGRLPYTNWLLSEPNVEDEKVVWAMKVTGVLEIKDKFVTDLSGGQKQRVFIAMALAQDTSVLFLDEPTTFLDIRYQIELLKLVRQLNEEFQITIVMVLHDINQALEYSHEIIGMKKGNVLVQGEPKKVITEEVIAEIFDISLKLFTIEDKCYVLTV